VTTAPRPIKLSRHRTITNGMTTSARPTRRHRMAGWTALLATAALLVGCSTDTGDATLSALPADSLPAPEPTADEPAVAVPATESAASDPAPGTTAPAGPPATTGASTPVIEQLSPAASGLPEVLATNSHDVPIALDETALLACANNQIAWVDLQRGDEQSAANYLSIAATRAAASAVQEVAAQASALESATRSFDRAVVDGFLSLCTERGFEY
jgi:hypothetical protein